MKIIDVQSDVFEWERPGIWNGGHFYGPGRLHKVTVKTDEGVEGYGWNGGTPAERFILPHLCPPLMRSFQGVSSFPCGFPLASPSALERSCEL